MHLEKYLKLLIPFLFIGIILILILPNGFKHYAILMPLIFWLVYYIWVLVDQKAKID